MKNLIVLLVFAASACQPPPSGNPLSLTNDYRVVATESLGGGTGVEHSALATTGDGPGGAHLIFLNFGGATIQPAPDGFTDDSAQNQSWLAQGSARTIPAFDASPYAPQYTQQSAQDWVTNKYKSYYAAYNVLISTTRPTSGRYLMVMIGGQPADLQGGSNATSEAGVAPLDCGNSQESNIAYNFAATLAPNKTGFSIPDALLQVAEDAAHESGHSFGLEHTSNMMDIMYPTLNDSITGFGGEANLSDGSSTCTRGADTQNSAALLTSNIGAASGMPLAAPPTVAFTSPANGANVALTFEVDVSATAATGLTIAHVDVSLGNQSFTLTTAPYKKSITVTQAATYVVTAIAYDSSGATATTTLKVNAAGMTTPNPTSSPEPSPSNAPDGGTTTSTTGTTGSGGTTGTNPTGKAVGEACHTTLDCASAICKEGVCSTHCDLNNTASCPSPLLCAPTSDGDLCVPEKSASSGCSAVPGSSPIEGALWLLLVLAFGFRRRIFA